ncbi:glutaredoxin family protein [Angustibacter aerolatus]|uniref:Thioredoxin family protein n=1 Tax=Angustibacter aerolatus TaxID=1162965 RepID=A0ABQ6JHY9_9ACTN|nr:glutaredoxin family protein [Angustibacter aerolatus]GMA87823.1 hypothetical protein GCM10025868_30730 [Angustibacter aerolatus]
MADTASDAAEQPRVVLFGRAGCHLCDEARDVVVRVTAETGAAWHELDVDSVPGLQAKYGDLVPVVLVDGQQVGYYRIDPERVRTALADTSRRSWGRYCG